MDDSPRATSDAVRVVVVGGRALARLLSAAVPVGWRVDAVPAWAPGTVADFVVLFSPVPELVQEFTAQGLAVVALLDRRAPSAAAIDALEAGASICLRDHDPRLLAGYLSQRWAPRHRSSTARPFDDRSA